MVKNTFNELVNKINVSKWIRNVTAKKSKLGQTAQILKRVSNKTKVKSIMDDTFDLVNFSCSFWD